MTRRRSYLPALAGGVLLTLAAARAADQTVLVEDWSRQPLGHRGIPIDWQGQNWGNPGYDMSVIIDAGRRVLRLRSPGDGSTISKDVRGTVDLQRTPILEWSWKVTTLPTGGNSCRGETDDQAIQLYVVWPRLPTAIRSRIIGYVWDSTMAVGVTCRSQTAVPAVTYVVVRSGGADLGRWLTERRNLVEDFRRIYGDGPESPAVISIASDSNDTHSTAEAFIGPIWFSAPSR